MATVIQPPQVARIANSAYAMRTTGDMDRVLDLAPDLEHTFNVAGATRLEGVTGVLAQARSGMGYMARGTGSRQGECLIAIRGTATGYDALTDLRFAGMRGPSGYLVDVGFWRAAQSILPRIQQQLRGTRTRVLHIVGHSLGGAVATLISDALTCGETDYEVKLYTFGAPRSGVEAHAQYLSGRLGARNIYRVYHDTDPVPMLPMYPYAHIPYGSNAYRLKGRGLLIAIDAHLLRGYQQSVKGCTWASLPVILPEHDSFEAASAWLERVARQSDSTIIMGSARALALILSALDWIVHAPGKVAALGVFAGATLLDGLARVLYSGALQSIRIADAVRNLLVAAMRVMGRTLTKTASVTVQLIQFVLGMLFQYIATATRRALSVLDML